MFDTEFQNYECVQVINDDTDFEGDETFKVTLSDATDMFGFDSPDNERVFTIVNGTASIALPVLPVCTFNR